MDRIHGSPLASRDLELCVRELGAVEVARRLGVTPVVLDMWRSGQAAMPQPDFLKLVDVLVELNPGWEDWEK